MERARSVFGFALLILALGCGAPEDRSAPTISAARPGAEPEPPRQRDLGAFAAPENPFVIAPGFVPDPRVARGRAGGPHDATVRNPNCTGFLPAKSSHQLRLVEAFASLRVVVSAAVDTTLVIQLSNGVYLCNDDSEGYNPIIEAQFPAGLHRVYVGTYSQDPTDSTDYIIGVTELPSVTAASLRE